MEFECVYLAFIIADFMTLSPLVIQELPEFISGDNGYLPSLKGKDILKLFNRYGFNDVYDYGNGGMPDGVTRKMYIEDKLKGLNGKIGIQELLEYILSKDHFSLDPDLDVAAAAEQLNEWLIKDKYKLVGTMDGTFKLTGALIAPPPKVEVHFEQIQQQIINELEKARFLIWVAVAWLTDPELCRILHKKKREGVNVQIVAVDDGINARLKGKIEQYFEAYYILPAGYFKNLMHHKFCVIDLKTVIHGSYNWTVKAQYNQESISVTTGYDTAASFAQTFIELKQSR